MFSIVRPRDIVFVVDSSNYKYWPVILGFTKQIVSGIGASPEGTHYAVVAFADGAAGLVMFPTGDQPQTGYNVLQVNKMIDGAANSRPLGKKRNIEAALQVAKRMLTEKTLGGRPNAYKVLYEVKLYKLVL